jgi:hypothetical protein
LTERRFEAHGPAMTLISPLNLPINRRICGRIIIS